MLVERPLTLVSWGIKHVTPNCGDEWLAKIEELVSHFKPDALVFENCVGSRRSVRVQQLLARLADLSERWGLRMRDFSRLDLKFTFASCGATTKDQIAHALARWFPEIAPHVPRKRRPWMKEDRWMTIFTALSLAVTLLHPPAKPKRAASTSSAP